MNNRLRDGAARQTSGAMPFAAWLWLFFCLLASPALPALAADDDLSIGRMRVMIWPEHDDNGVLAVYDGRFAEEAKFPTTAKFFIPKGVIVNDMCSLSPGGQHFCQLYEIEKGEGKDIVHLSLPYANFYISFHTPSLDMRNENRKFDYLLKANHPIRKLEIDVQQPLRSTAFSVSLPNAVVKEQKGFNHYQYAMENVARNDELAIQISYIKKDDRPSVDIKFAVMSGERKWGSPYDGQRRAKTLIYVLFATGVAAAFAGLAWIAIAARKGKNKART